MAAPLDIAQIRGRKRSKKIPPTKAQKLLRRKAKEEKETLKRRFTYIQRVQAKRLQGKCLSVQWPGRFDAEEDASKPACPAGGVYLADQMRTQFFPLHKALDLHRRIQSPSILGNPNVVLKLRIELNMSTEKATKFIPDSRQLIALPNPFIHSEKRTIMAFAATPAMQAEAMEAGADIALGVDAIKKIVKGRFNIDDYDFCVAHEDMAAHIVSLRGVLKTRFPTRLNGALGTDLIDIIKRFLSGVNLVVRGDPGNKLWGLCDPTIGKLDMSNEQLEENVETVLNILFKQRNPALGPYINRACLLTEPSNGSFYPIDVKPWEPIPTVSDIGKIEKRKKKKKAKVLLDLDDENEDIVGGEEKKTEDVEVKSKKKIEAIDDKKKKGQKKETTVNPLANLEKYDRKALLALM